MTNRLPLVSVIMPVYNCEKYVARAINSICKQTYSNWELLICDDGSADNSREIIEEEIKENHKISFFKNKKNLGIVRTTNRLFDRAVGDYIMLQDADDWSHEDRIRQQLEYFNKFPETGLVGTGSYRVNDNGDVFEIMRHPVDDLQIKKFLKQGVEPCFVCASIMIKSDVIKTIGGYREFYSGIGAADYDWIYRIAEITSLANIDEPLYYNRRHLNSFTKSFNKNPLRKFSPQIAFYCYQQRLNGEKDIIADGGQKLEHYLKELQKNYLKDPSFIYLEYAEFLYSIENFWRASLFALYGTARNPLLISNYKNLLHYLRMAIFS